MIAYISPAKLKIIKNTVFCDDGRPIITKLVVEKLSSKEEILVYKVETKNHLRLAVNWRDDFVIDLYLDDKQVREKESKPKTKFQIEYKSH